MYKHILLLFFVTYASVTSQISASEEESNKIIQITSKIEQERVNLSRINELMELLEIKPGMTILDVGTGTGQYAYEFAERLKGTGKVFATDSNINLINYVTAEARRRDPDNLEPVLVKSEGVDDFYSKHKYDLITLFHVSLSRSGETEYFKKMRNFLTENGRLIFLNYQYFSPFSSDDFADWKGLIKELSTECITSPFYKRLKNSILEIIKKSAKQYPDEFSKKEIVDNFNDILTDLSFFRDFLNEELAIKKEVFLLPEERDYINWFLMYFKDTGVFEKAQKDLNAKEIRAIKKLNKLLVVQRFRQYFYKNGTFPPFFIGNVHRQTSELLIKRELEEAGYKLENEYDLLSYDDVLVFTANKDAEGK